MCEKCGHRHTDYCLEEVDTDYGDFGLSDRAFCGCTHKP